jgi:hypothetical protein
LGSFAGGVRRSVRERGGYNVATVFVWVIWWVGPGFFIAFVGNILPLVTPGRRRDKSVFRGVCLRASGYDAGIIIPTAESIHPRE